MVPNCFRVIQHSNWKIFLENQLDALHPSVMHQSTGRAAHEVEKQIAKKAKKGEAPLSYHMLSAFATVTIDKWDAFQTLNYPHGHCILAGYMGLRPQDPDTLAYDKMMIKAYGQKRFEEIVGVNIHHVLIYPGLSVQSPLQQLRAVRPLGRRPHAHRDLALPPEGRARGDLPPLARLLQPGELAGDAGQRRRPGELLEVPPGPRRPTAATGSASVATSAATSRRTASSRPRRTWAPPRRRCATR